MSKSTHVTPVPSNHIHNRSVLQSFSTFSQNIDQIQLEKILNQQPHFFILIMGFIIGSVIAIAIGFSFKVSALAILLLTCIPFVLCFLLRKVYIHTLLHFQD